MGSDSSNLNDNEALNGTPADVVSGTPADGVSGTPADAVMNEGGESFWRLTRKEFRKNRPALYSLYVLVAMAVLALTADLIAGNKPYYMVYQGETYFPAFRQYAVYTGLMDWPEELRTRRNFKRYAYSDAVFPLIPYAPDEIRLGARYERPGSDHLFGTDRLGRDVLSGLIHGTR